MYQWQGGRGKGKQRDQGQDSGYWSYWPGSQQAWNKQKQKNQQAQQSFPHYDSREIAQNTQAGDVLILEVKNAATGSDATLVRDLQQLVNQARKAEQRLKKLHGDRKRKELQWVQYEKDIKESFLQEKQRHQDTLHTLDEEIEKAARAQDEARARVRIAASGEVPRPPMDQQAATPDPWSEQVALWEMDQQACDSSFGEILQRAMQSTHAEAPPCASSLGTETGAAPSTPVPRAVFPRTPPASRSAVPTPAPPPQVLGSRMQPFPPPRVPPLHGSSPSAVTDPYLHPTSVLSPQATASPGSGGRPRMHRQRTPLKDGAKPHGPLHIRSTSPSASRVALVDSKRAQSMALMIDGSVNANTPRTNAGLLDDDGGGPLGAAMPSGPPMDTME